ncbi:hypothetical protein CI238_12580, partial [Colletotrichum incanum]
RSARPAPPPRHTSALYLIKSYLIGISPRQRSQITKLQPARATSHLSSQPVINNPIAHRWIRIKAPSMSAVERILSWRSGLPSPPSPQRKRKRSIAGHRSLADCRSRLPSPPDSSTAPGRTKIMVDGNSVNHDDSNHDIDQNDTEVATPQRAKKTKYADATHGIAIDDADFEPTPKAPQAHPAPPPTDISSAASSSITSIASESAYSINSTGSPSNGKKRRRQPSPRKHSVILATENAIKPVSFGAERPPDALQALVQRIKFLAAGHGIVSPSHKDALLREAETNYQFEWVEDKTFTPPLPTDAIPTRTAPFERDGFGPTPAISAVKRIWSNANDCETFQHFEPQWNCAVHFPILETAFEASRRVSFCNCTAAQIHRDYVRTGMSSRHNKRVDFCIFVRDDTPALELKAMTAPFKSINHTEYPALLTRPLAVSIETKVGGHAWAEAMNQTSIWLVAQWDWVDFLCAKPGHNAVDDTVAGDVAPEDPRQPKPSAAAKAGLVFLPGIIILGHDWYMVAVTRTADGTTRIWNKIPLGSTETIEGIYQVIAILQLLAHWAETEYWPWFRHNVLGIE